LPQFDVKTLGLGHSGVFSHWSNRMVVKAIRHGAAMDKRASSSAPLKQDNDGVIETSIPARLDALRWGGFHTRVVAALGITWILDGLEVTLAGALSGALKESPTLQFSNFDVGLANSAYLAGAVLGALGFGWLTDRIGRKKLFFITLALYLTATAATALSWSVASYTLFRFLTGAGIGGEYTAINSTIQAGHQFSQAQARQNRVVSVLVEHACNLGTLMRRADRDQTADPALGSVRGIGPALILVRRVAGRLLHQGTSDQSAHTVCHDIDLGSRQ
jgi:hypothetical protein